MRFIEKFILGTFILFDVLYLLRTIIVHNLKIRVWMMGKPTNNALERIVEFAALPLVLVYDTFVFLQAVNIRVLPMFNELIRTLWLSIAGAVCCGLGLILLFLTLLALLASMEGLTQKYSPDKFLSNGIYAFIRNPVLTAVDLYAAGIALIFPTIPSILCVFGAFFGAHVHILAEEKYLLITCGGRYAAYMKRTKRYGFF